MENIFIFIGARKDFNNFLSERNVDDTALKFLDLIRQYNELVRASNVGFLDKNSRFTTGNKEDVENCVVRSEDFASVLEHVVTNFSQIISMGHDIENLYLHNPPKRVVEILESEYDSNIEYRYSEYRKITKDNLKEVSSCLDGFVVGQKVAKRKVLSSLYRLSNKNDKKPIVMLFQGPSGVGKTELAKSLSDYLGGNLLRIQFSMMQTNEASNYIFGDKHSKSSFARDLLQRESNIVLIDEFDKVHPNFYNSFYEIFDEGKFNDLNYSVDVKNCVFILTSNFKNETEIIKKLGMPIYSRISSNIRFDELSDNEKIEVITRTYENVLSNLDTEEVKIVEELNMKEWFIDHASNYNNIRLLNSRIQEAVYDALTSRLLDD
ncbi:AAA family ATPase [Bacillus infantis]|uniref:AAA family ATPase n=1 Tax=Bacillus infantis TaxID=324767 RepID=UPI00209EA6ED|nr:AAA family ATPase [Bacillus infantis]MCP1156625.1 AAA family ATPase [Bacillus infantis]